ncbi:MULTISPECIES: CBM35 domain-containing protein [unclassified Streptomyces]|uniref:CBM35 domain-containing protein n=1 Tax=unclassified Streptomyces TaxID=2593676 RepID=UPI0030CEF742
MTPGNNGASTPEEDDPFGYLYADGQANGATPPSGGGGYGYPGSVNRVRAVGERKYGQQTAQGTYGQQTTAPYGQVPQQGGYGQPNAHYGAPETVPGGAQTARTPMPGHGDGGGRGRGPNTKGLLIGAVAVVAAVVIGISVAMLGGGDGDKKGDQAGPTASTAQSASPTQSETKGADTPAELPKTDAKTLNLGAGVTTASDVKGAKADGGVYVTGFNHVGASITWSVSGIPKAGKYTLEINYGVPGKDANATLTVNGTAQDRPLNMKNFAQAAEGDYEKGWTNTWADITLNKGTNTIQISCADGNQCDANFDQLWLESGWK